MGRIQGLAEIFLTSSQAVKSGKGEVHSITIAYNGVTAGIRCYLRDGTNGTSPVLVPFVFPAAHGVITKEWPQGKAFTDGLYFDEGTQSGNDTVFVEMTYK